MDRKLMCREIIIILQFESFKETLWFNLCAIAFETAFRTVLLLHVGEHYFVICAPSED